jgi:MSHA biogenesis protein MshJ
VKLSERLGKLRSAVDALTFRERLILFLGVIVIVGGLWEALLAGPLEAREKAASAQIQGARTRIQQLDEAMALAAAGIGEGMPARIERLRMLEEQVALTDESVRSITSDLIGPTEMREVLEGLIERQQGLRLVRAGNLEVRELIEREETGEVAAGPMLYRHGLTLELEGTYLDCLAYLRAVEQLPWTLYWGGLSLTALEYPLNSISIEIFSLSLDEDWIGV